MSVHCYRVVVEEQLGPRYASLLNGMTRTSSHLHGPRERIAGPGLTLLGLPLDTGGRAG